MVQRKKKNINFRVNPKQGGLYQRILAYFEAKRWKFLPHWQKINQQKVNSEKHYG